MRKFAFFILIVLFTIKASAQTAPANYNFALNKFKLFYNSNQPDSIFNMFSDDMKTALPLDKFKATTAQLISQLGKLNKTDFVKYNAPLAVYKATFDNNVFLLNLALNDQNKLTGLRLSPYEDPATTTPLDPSLTESPVSLKTLAGTLSGTLTMPKIVSGKIPVVLIIAGSGPTDRDGNGGPELHTDAYKLLAYALGKAGIASLRYDKRMIGQSVTINKENQLRFEDYVDDAVSLIGMLSDDERFSKIIIAGHSEGSLVGMLACADEPVKGYISLSGAGQPAEKILTEQMKSQPQYIADGFKAILDSLRKGKITDNVDPALYAIARPSIQPYIMSWCRYDPQREIKKLKMPVLIIQGTTDLQVSVDNAYKLKDAKSNAKLIIIRGMNHILKDAPPDKEQNLATYKNPDLPLDTTMVTAVINFIKGLD
jgi:pimeloyl-ACP methyl ester carboxylesterase